MSIFKKRGDDAAGTPTDAGTDTRRPDKKQSESAVLRYVTVFFVIVMAVLLLSYFIQQRQSADTIDSLTAKHSEFSIQAMENIEKLQDTNRELTAELEDEQAKVAALEDELSDEKAKFESEKAALTESCNSAVNTAQMRRQAAERLLDLYMAQQSGADMTAALAAMEPYGEYLDGAYAELYESIKISQTEGNTEK